MRKTFYLVMVAILLLGLVGCFDNLEEKQRKDFYYVHSQYRKIDKEFDKVDYNILSLLDSFYKKTTSNEAFIRWIDVYIEDVVKIKGKFSQISLGSSNRFSDLQINELEQGISDYNIGLATYLDSLELYKALAKQNNVSNQEKANQKYEEAIDQLVNALHRLRDVGRGVGANIEY